MRHLPSRRSGKPSCPFVLLRLCLLTLHQPCQSLFVAPCSHVWHYKCIRPLIEKEYPCFLCPNCRAVADLDRDIEEDEITDEMWEMVPDHDGADHHDHAEVQSQDTTTAATAGTVGASEPTTALTAVTAAADTSNRITVTTTTTTTTTATPSQNTRATLPAPPPPRPTVGTSNAQSSAAATVTQPIATPPSQTGSWRHRRRPDMSYSNADHDSTNTEDSGNSSAGEMNNEGPMTPMNDAGPFLLDGNDGRVRDGTRNQPVFMPLGTPPLATPPTGVVNT